MPISLSIAIKLLPLLLIDDIVGLNKLFHGLKILVLDYAPDFIGDIDFNFRLSLLLFEELLDFNLFELELCDFFMVEFRVLVALVVPEQQPTPFVEQLMALVVPVVL